MIGENTIVKETNVGNNTKIWHNCNIYDSDIGKNCIIGSFTEIGGSRVGDNCKIEAFVFIPPDVKIGDNVFIGPRVSFANDTYPRASSFGERKSIVVEEGVSIGISATILPGVILHKNCFVGAGALVTKDVPAHGLVTGVPAKLVGHVCECKTPLTDWKCHKCGKEYDKNSFSMD